MYGDMRDRDEVPRQCQGNARESPAARAHGLDALHGLCREIYPDQGNPLTVTAIVKYW